MKTLITLCLLLMASVTKAQTIKLDFKPGNQVVKICFDGLAIYTDTTSLFYVYKRYGTKETADYDRRVKNLVTRQLKISNSDTVTFTGDFIPFNDGEGNNYEKDHWYVKWAIIKLTKENKLKIVDRRQQAVKTIETKKIGKRKEGYVRRSFVNNETQEELFGEFIFVKPKMKASI